MKKAEYIDSRYRNLLESLTENKLKPDLGIILPPIQCFYHWEGDGIDLCDYGGCMVPIEAGKCKDCPNFCVMNIDLERYYGG